MTERAPSSEDRSDETLDLSTPATPKSEAETTGADSNPKRDAPSVPPTPAKHESTIPVSPLPLSSSNQIPEASAPSTPVYGTQQPGDGTGGLEAPAQKDTGTLPPDPLINTVLGKCMLHKRIGEGGMGTVYMGKHLTLDVEVAVKVLPRALAQRDRGFVDRFLREARTAARVHHPNIVQVLDVDFQQGVYFIVMEYIDGETAGQRLRRKKRLSEREVIEIGLDISSALDYARRKDIIHRDIKPENILISRDGEVKISDLGLAKRVAGETGSDLTLGDQVIGTPSYISPEQARSARNADHRSDLYSLGATLFHLAAGRPPFVGTSAFDTMTKHQTQPAPELRAYRAEISLEMAALVKRLLNKNPDHRYQTAGQLIIALRDLYERIVPKDERDAILSGTPVHTQESSYGIQPYHPPQDVHHKSRAHMKKLNTPESMPAKSPKNDPPPTPYVSPEPRQPLDKVKAPPERVRTAAWQPQRDEDDNFSESAGGPSRLWMGFLALPFFNSLAYLWVGSAARKREWFYWGMVFLLFQVLFASFWEVMLAKAGLGAAYIIALLYGLTLRREYEHRVMELPLEERERGF